MWGCWEEGIIGKKKNHSIPANSHTLGASLTPASWKLRSHVGSRLRDNFSCLVEKCELLPSCLKRKPCVKWINDKTFLVISDFWSEKHWEQDWDWEFRRLLQKTLGIFWNDCVVFKNPSTSRIKISRLYLRKSWQVYPRNPCVTQLAT